ncbi:MAG: rsmE [Gammaproteobacteria bacterium]|jgi:16S rRNA (uracil1498-N3)-methyltransferase|nr:rsmE [Gammaproteobacteria bacterium]
MRLNRVYQNQALSEGQSLQLDAEASNHLANVLRMREAEKLIVFNGEGDEYLCSVISAQKKSMTVLLESKQTVLRESPLFIHLAQAVAKGDKMDLIIQKAVELGANAITPILTERSNVKLDSERFDKKMQHWQKVAISACEQCGRNVVPQVNAPLSLTKFIEHHEAELKLILHPGNGQNLSTLSTPIASLIIMIGPEGGFAEQEISLAQSRNYIKLNLGPRILRTETAPLAAISILQSKWGDL